MGINAPLALGYFNVNPGTSVLNLGDKIAAELTNGAEALAKAERVTCIYTNDYDADPTLRVLPFAATFYKDGNLTNLEYNVAGLTYRPGQFTVVGNDAIRQFYFTAGDNGFLDGIVETMLNGGSLSNPFTAVRYAEKTWFLDTVVTADFGFTAFELANADKAIVCASQGDIRLAWDVAETPVSGSSGLLLKFGNRIEILGNDNIRLLRFAADANSAVFNPVIGIQLESLRR